MATVLNRTTKQLIKSVNTPDYPESDWIIDPDLSGVVGVTTKYWVITGDVVSEMSQAEKDVVDAAEVQALEDGEILELDNGILKRFVLVLLDEINRSRTADGANTVTIAQLKNAMRAK
jgi:hypothetical protein